MSKRILGLWNMGDGSFHNKLSPKDSKNLIKAAIRDGITSFDTAFSYKEADSMLYSALKEAGCQRESIEIISKIMPVPTLEKKAETVLRRLNTEYIDILLIHWPSDEEAVYSSLRKLENLREKGICKSIGVSNFPYELLKKTSEDFPLSFHERPLSLIWNKDWKEERKLGLKTLAYAPLGLGLLTLKYKKREEITDARKDLYVWESPVFKDLLSYMSTLPYSAASIAMNWVKREAPYGIIQGASRPEQLHFGSIELKADEISKLSEYADAITASSSSDNIFSHNYATIAP